VPALLAPQIRKSSVQLHGNESGHERNCTQQTDVQVGKTLLWALPDNEMASRSKMDRI
jgi:hypothetical protein